MIKPLFKFFEPMLIFRRINYERSRDSPCLKYSSLHGVEIPISDPSSGAKRSAFIKETKKGVQNGHFSKRGGDESLSSQ